MERLAGKTKTSEGWASDAVFQLVARHEGGMFKGFPQCAYGHWLNFLNTDSRLESPNKTFHQRDWECCINSCSVTHWAIAIRGPLFTLHELVQCVCVVRQYHMIVLTPGFVLLPTMVTCWRITLALPSNIPYLNNKVLWQLNERRIQRKWQHWKKWLFSTNLFLETFKFGQLVHWRFHK